MQRLNEIRETRPYPLRRGVLLFLAAAALLAWTNAVSSQSAPSQDPVPANHVSVNKNSGFEEVNGNVVPGWVSPPVDGAAWVPSEARAHTGRRSMALKGGGTQKDVRLVSDPFPVQAGDCVNFLAWVFSDGEPHYDPCAFVEAETGGVWQAVEPKAASPMVRTAKYHREWAWKHRGYDVFMPRGATAARLVVSCPGSEPPDVTWYVDDFRYRTISFADYLKAHEGGERLPDIVLVGVDTLERSRIGCYGAARTYTPNIDRLAAEGRLYQRVTTACPWTKPSFGSIFTSLYPSQHGAEFVDSQLPDDVDTLADVLRARGYFTAGFVRSPFDGFIGPGMRFNKGFDVYFYSDDEAITFDAMKRFLDVNGDRLAQMKGGGLFLFWHFLEPHGDYDNRFPGLIHNRGLQGDVKFNAEGILKILAADPARFNEQDLDYVRACYESEVDFVDAHIGELVARFRYLGFWERMNMVFTADHGEGFGERPGIFGHSQPYISSTLIPLILRFPGCVTAGVRDEQSLVSNLDIMPTIVALAGAKMPEGREGRNLLAQNGDSLHFALTAEYGISEDKAQNPSGSLTVRDARYKLIVNDATQWADPNDWTSPRWVVYAPNSSARYELYDLESDLWELHDIAQQKPDVLERLKKVLDAHCDHTGIHASGNAPPRPAAPKMSEETLNQLEAEGYLPASSSKKKPTLSEETKDDLKALGYL